MKDIEFDYTIVKDNGDEIECYAEAKLTDKNIKDVAEFILSDKDHQSGELQDIPGNVYDRFVTAAYEDAIRRMNSKKSNLTETDEVILQKELPSMLVELLPEDVQKVLPKDSLDEEHGYDMFCGGKVINCVEEIAAISEQPDKQ